MANTFTAPFVQVQKTGTAVVTAAAANIATDTPTNLQLLITAGINGALINKITAMPLATNTGASLLLYSSKDEGATYRLIDSELMAAYTLAATTAVPKTDFGNISLASYLRLEAGERLYVGSQVALAAGIVFRCEGADL